MIKRLVRSVFLAGLVAAAVAAVKAMTRKDDPLPTPAAAPAGGPWPPLRNETAPPDPVAEPAPTQATQPPAGPAPVPKPAPKPAPEPAKPKTESKTEAPAVAPEPDGVPVDAAAASASSNGKPSSGDGWVEPTPDGECPDGYPIKAKMSSKIFHSPGQLNYDRTTPDRCYASAEAAEADGLRAAKR